MTWLRELMENAEPRILSFGALARSCLAHDDWPQYSLPKPTSLAALFSKFDRGMELEWLHDRPDVQHVLAAVLGCPLGALLRPLSTRLELEDTSLGRHRFEDAAAARPLIHEDEPLPPGFPSELMQPHEWSRLLWRPATRHEFEVVRDWLQVRRLAQTQGNGSKLRPNALGLTTTPLALPQFCFVESSTELRTRPVSGPVCAVVMDDAEPPPGFELLPSAFPQQIPALVTWFKARQPSDGLLSGVDAISWLERGWARGIVDGFDAAIGLLAALDEAPTSPSTSWGELAEHFVQLRISTASIANRSEATWLADNTLSLLVNLVGETLERDSRPWDAPRDLESWLELVPHQFHGVVTSHWARALFDKVGVRVDAVQLERALERVPPAAFALIRGLEAAGLLRGSQALRLGPRWLGLWAHQAALEALITSAPERWGEALLHQHAAVAVRRRLETELSSHNSRLLDSLLDGEDDESAATTVAVETAFELVGLSICAGEEFDREQLEALWQKQAELVVVFEDGTSAPRVLSAANDLNGRGNWLIACWAISEQLEVRRGRGDCAPWNNPKDIPLVSLDAAMEALTKSNDVEFVANANAMLTRLFSSHASAMTSANAAASREQRLEATDEQRLHPLLAVPIMLLEPSWRCFAALNSHAVRTLTQLRGHSDQWVDSVWRLWLSAGCPGGPSPLHPHFEQGRTFWERMPEAALDALLQNDHEFLASLPYELLSQRMLGKLVAYGGFGPHPHRWSPAAMAYVPGEQAHHLARRLVAQPACVRAMWLHHEQQLLSLISTVASDDEFATVTHVLDNANPQTPDSLISLIRKRLDQRGVADPLPRRARRWLQSLAGQPGAHRLEAHELLTEIESRLHRASFHENSSA